MKSHLKFSKNCSIHGKNREISGQYNFWTPIKSNILDVWNWNFWTLFGSEIEVGGHSPSGSLSGYAPVTMQGSKTQVAEIIGTKFIWVRDITFFAAPPPPYDIFWHFFENLLPTFRVTYILNSLITIL